MRISHIVFLVGAIAGLGCGAAASEQGVVSDLIVLASPDSESKPEVDAYTEPAADTAGDADSTATDAAGCTDACSHDAETATAVADTCAVSNTCPCKRQDVRVYDISIKKPSGLKHAPSPTSCEHLGDIPPNLFGPENWFYDGRLDTPSEKGYHKTVFDHWSTEDLEEFHGTRYELFFEGKKPQLRIYRGTPQWKGRLSTPAAKCTNPKKATDLVVCEGTVSADSVDASGCSSTTILTDVKVTDIDGADWYSVKLPPTLVLGRSYVVEDLPGETAGVDTTTHYFPRRATNIWLHFRLEEAIPSTQINVKKLIMGTVNRLHGHTCDVATGDELLADFVASCVKVPQCLEVVCKGDSTCAPHIADVMEKNALGCNFKDGTCVTQQRVMGWEMLVDFPVGTSN